MTVRAIVGVILAGSVLAACNQKSAETGCSSPDAIGVVSSILTEQLEKATTEKVGGETNDANISQAKIRATIALLKIAIEDIRTTKSDPNSTKKFCEGTLKLTFPLNVIQEADRAREMAGMTTASAYVEEGGYERAADSFTHKLTFTVQPTDDGEKVYGEVEDVSPLAHIGELLAAHLLLGNIEAAKQQEATQAQAKAAAEAEQAKADLDLAAADNKLASQAISEVWNALPEETRSEMLESQRAWIRKKTADCNIQAAETAEDATAREAARLRCDTGYTQTRSGELRQLLY